MTLFEDFSFEGDDRLREALLRFLNSSFDQGNKIKGLKGVELISDWYSEAKAARKEQGRYNKRVIVSTIVNRTSEELLRHLEPFYNDTILKSIGIKTQFKEGVESSFSIEPISIKPFVKFVKRVDPDRREIASVKFLFKLDTSIYLNKLQIRVNTDPKSIKIDKLGIEATLTLLQVTIEATLGVPAISLVKPIKLGSKKFEIKNLKGRNGGSTNGGSTASKDKPDDDSGGRPWWKPDPKYDGALFQQQQRMRR